MRPLRLAEQAGEAVFGGAEVVQKWCKSGAKVVQNGANEWLKFQPIIG